MTSRSATIAASSAHSQPLGGRTLAYDRAGAAEPLMVLHGLRASRRSWDPALPSLVEQRDVIAVDLPGHGDSSPSRARDSAPADLAAKWRSCSTGWGCRGFTLAATISAGAWRSN